MQQPNIASFSVRRNKRVSSTHRSLRSPEPALSSKEREENLNHINSVFEDCYGSKGQTRALEKHYLPKNFSA